MGIWATGLFVYTMLLRVAIPILNGDFHVANDGVGSYIGDEVFFAHQGTVDKNEEPAAKPH
jgi:hypothetical protein